MASDRNTIRPDAARAQKKQKKDEVDLLSIIDLSAIKALMTELHNLTNLAFALIGLDGKVLIAAGWQDICIKFHRANPVTFKHCIESDTILAAGAELGEYKMYKCINNLWHVAIPLVIEGRHLANLFMGQFLVKEELIDYNLFRVQAREYGFAEDAYLAALEQVPRLTREETLANINFFTMLCHMISILGLRNVELSRVLIQLRARDELLHKLSDRVPGMIYQLQFYPDGRFFLPYASKGINDIFSVTSEEVRDNLAPILEKIHSDDVDAVVESIRESFHTLEQWDCNFRVVLPDGQLKWIRGSATPEKMEDGSTLCHGFLFDITELKQVEAEIRARNEELGAFYELSSHLRKAGNTAELLPLLLDKALDLYKTEHGAITLLSADQQKLTVACGKGIWRDSAGFTLSLREGLHGRVLGTGKAYVGSAHEEYTEELFLTNAGEMGPLLVVPLQSEDELIGTLIIARSRAPDSRPFTPNEVRLLETIGGMAGNALRRQRLYEEAQRRLRLTQALRHIDMAITGSFDLRVTYKTIFEEIARQLHIDAAAILFLDPHAMTLRYEAWHGFNTENLSKLRLRIGEGYAGKACLEKRPIFIPDLKAVAPDPYQGANLLAEGFRSYYAFPLMAKGRTLGVLEAMRRDKFDADEEWLYFLEMLAGQAAIAIDDAALFHNLELANVELIQSYDATIEGWAYALDLRDEATEGHSRRVADMAVELAVQMGVKGEALSHLKRGALLHDIGKMGIPDSILYKPGKLTRGEWKIMRKHPEYAYQMLSPIEYLRPALDIPYCHHEKWDGSGYPCGLKGKEIPLAARIFAVVDIYDALTSPRPYRKAWSKKDAFKYIRQQSGKHFDPQIVEIFLKKYAPDLLQQ